MSILIENDKLEGLTLIFSRYSSFSKDISMRLNEKRMKTMGIDPSYPLGPSIRRTLGISVFEPMISTFENS